MGLEADVIRFDHCRYLCDEDGTPFCEHYPKLPTSLSGSFCEKCGGAYRGDGKSISLAEVGVTPQGPVPMPAPTPAPTQPSTEEIAASLAERTGVDSTEILPAPEWTQLDPMLAFSAGKESIHLERAASVEIHLAEQAVVYAKCSPAQLVQALLDRDRIIAQFGRETADGRMGGRLLREFVRAALSAADKNDPASLQRFLEQALGAEKADARQLKLKGGTTL